MDTIERLRLNPLSHRFKFSCIEKSFIDNKSTFLTSTVGNEIPAACQSAGPTRLPQGGRSARHFYLFLGGKTKSAVKWFGRNRLIWFLFVRFKSSPSWLHFWEKSDAGLVSLQIEKSDGN